MTKALLYGALTPKERRKLRGDYIVSQGGMCYYCKCDIGQSPPINITRKAINWRKFPENFLRYPIHLHHDHVTGLTIGAVHAYCNAVLWQYHGK